MFDIGWKIFAHPVNLEDSLIGTFMGIFLFVASMFSFVMTVRPAPSTAFCTNMPRHRNVHSPPWVLTTLGCCYQPVVLLPTGCCQLHCTASAVVVFC